MKKDTWIMIAVIAAIIIGGVFLMTSGGGPRGTPDVNLAPEEAELVRENSHRKGNGDAKVTIVEFGDFQCPACAAAHPIMKHLSERYTSEELSIVYRHLPLVNIHAHAFKAAEAAEAAGSMGKFWEMHDKLFENQDAWSRSANPIEIFVSYARELGLDEARFRQSIKDHEFEDQIQQDVNDATALGAQGTPTFAVNGRFLTQNPTLEQFVSMINSELTQ